MMEAPTQESEAIKAYKMELMRAVPDKLVPNPENVSAEIPLIGHLSGTRPSIDDVYEAAVVFEGLNSLEEGRRIQWDKLDPSEWMQHHSPGVHGKRAQQLVDLGKTEVNRGRKGLMGWLFGR